ncbi:hypothetical protein F2Q68_00038270 [Brassica cretica]|uniref:Secreted protein n=1 Tax=Brassica cretica TaxID=69181 RepID=A0A8S9MJL0_BRACR|nr:hypothetical protein F2Q68_00038270 [Brassica cretica]
MRPAPLSCLFLQWTGVCGCGCLGFARSGWCCCGHEQSLSPPPSPFFDGHGFVDVVVWDCKECMVLLWTWDMCVEDGFDHPTRPEE